MERPRTACRGLSAFNGKRIICSLFVPATLVPLTATPLPLNPQEMEIYSVIKTLHILSATIVFGTGLGIAFFMLRSNFTDDLTEKYFAARTTVLADFVFTLPAVVIQPLSGMWLIWQGGFDWQAPWLIATYCLYVVAGFCWLPVVWIQIELKRLILSARASGTPLPDRYFRLFRLWFLMGWPAFLGLLVIFYLMVSQPQ